MLVEEHEQEQYLEQEQDQKEKHAGVGTRGVRAASHEKVSCANRQNVIEAENCVFTENLKLL